jgi:preprotein translocase subunit YajC
MIEFITSAFAQDAATTAAKQPSLIASMAPLLLIFVVFYFFIIRPQQRKLRDHQSLLNAISKGDQVVTTGGIFGSVARLEDAENLLELEIADKVRIKIRKEAIAEVLTQKKAA